MIQRFHVWDQCVFLKVLKSVSLNKNVPIEFFFLEVIHNYRYFQKRADRTLERVDYRPKYALFQKYKMRQALSIENQHF